MSAEHRRGEGDELGDKIGQLEFDLAEIEKEKRRGKLKHRVNFKGKIDDPPEDGGEGVREPRKPGPHTNLGGAALTFPEIG